MESKKPKTANENPISKQFKSSSADRVPSTLNHYSKAEIPESLCLNTNENAIKTGPSNGSNIFEFN